MEVEPACPCLGGETKHDSHRPLSMREKIKAFNFLCSDSSQRRFKWKGQSPATLYLLLPTRRQRSRTFAANFAVDIIARDEDGLAPCHHAGFLVYGVSRFKQDGNVGGPPIYQQVQQLTVSRCHIACDLQLQACPE